jgi:hypothetical protein
MRYEVWPSSTDAKMAISDEEYLDTEEDANPVPTASSGIEADTQVSCISVKWISQTELTLSYKLGYSD